GQFGECRATPGGGLRARTGERLGEHASSRSAPVSDRAARAGGGQAYRRSRHVFPRPHPARIQRGSGRAYAERGVLESERDDLKAKRPPRAQEWLLLALLCLAFWRRTECASYDAHFEGLSIGYIPKVQIHFWVRCSSG